MGGISKLLRKPGYAVFLSILCTILSCLPFVSIATMAERLESVSLYLFLLWLFLILNLFLMNRYSNDGSPDTDDEQRG